MPLIKTIKNYLVQPQGFYSFFNIELWDRLSFYGLSSMLVLFLSTHFHYSNKSIYGIYGVFTSLTFLMPTISGYFADRYFNHIESIMIGIALVITGNFLLIIFTLHTVFLGLSLTILGIGFIKPNNPTLIGFLYTGADKRKDEAFTLFYMGMNLGAIVGPIIYGFLSLKFGWRYGFCVGLFGLSGILILCLYQFQHLKKIELRGKNLQQLKVVNWRYLGIGIVFCISTIYFLLTHTKFFAIFLGFIGLIIAFILYRIMLIQDRANYRNMLFLLILNLFSIFYFACQNQINSSLLLFVNTYLLSHHLSHKIPPGIFSALEPLFVILTAPIFAKLWQSLLNVLSEKDLILLRTPLKI